VDETTSPILFVQALESFSLLLLFKGVGSRGITM